MTLKLSVLFLFICFIIHVQISKQEPDYYRYLQQYGYTPKVEGRRLFTVLGKSPYTDAIRTFQRLYRLPETGELDETTKAYMKKARCGNPDIGTYDSIRQPVAVDAPAEMRTGVKARSGLSIPSKYVTGTGIWPKKHLKWFIEGYPQKQKKISTEELHKIFQQSFNDWEQHTSLKFEMVNNANDANLKIKFESVEHGDGYPFDGQGQTLAHAFFPTSGDIHFDDDEHFTTEYKNLGEDQYTLRLVASHEIGHALGLAHSLEPESLMFPLYQQFDANYRLSTDDQEGIQTLYGKKENIINTDDNSNKATERPGHHHEMDPLFPTDNWCSARITTGCEGPDGELYLFKDKQVWRYRARTKRSWDPEPKLISDRFPGINTTITACVKSANGFTYLFRNYRMWKLKTHWNADGPHIVRGKNYPQNPRIALLHNNIIYLLRGKLAFQFNENDNDRHLEIKSIDSILKTLPTEHIYSGFTYQKRHYLFGKKNVYVYDATSGKLVSGYPKQMKNGWFACEENKDEMKQKKKSTTTTTTTTTTRSQFYNRHHNRRPHQYRHHHHHHHHD